MYGEVPIFPHFYVNNRSYIIDVYCTKNGMRQTLIFHIALDINSTHTASIVAVYFLDY